MNVVSLKSKTDQGTPLEATFAPDRGMNLVSYKKGNLEIIDQSTKVEFENRFSGLGPLIGPHFYQRNPKIIKPLSDEGLFPHIAFTKARGDHDPFSHGIARYAPWKHEATENTIKGTLTGKDTWQDIPLAELEGQQFSMTFSAELNSKGLHLNLSVVSETASIVGIHYYYHLPRGEGRVISGVQKHYYDPNVKKLIPQEWNLDANHVMTFDLNKHADYAFHPFPNPRHADILLDAVDYRLRTTYSTASQENAWQLYHPEKASFVCIEPCTSQDPRHTNLTVSSIRITLEILD